VLTPTFRYHPSIVAQAFGTLGAMFPGTGDPGIGTGESLNEVPSTGQPWPEVQGALRAHARSGDLDPHAVARRAHQLRGPVLSHRQATIYDRPEIEVPIYVAAAGALVARYAGRSGDGFICTSGKKWELYTETLLPKVAEGIAAPTEPRKQPYDYMIELKVSFDTDASAPRRTRVTGRPLALTPEEKTSVEDPVEMQRLADALPLERRGEPLDRVERSRRACREDRAYVGLGFRHPRLPCARPDQPATRTS